MSSLCVCEHRNAIPIVNRKDRNIRREKALATVKVLFDEAGAFGG